MPVQRGHDAWAGNDVVPHDRQRLPMSRGSSLGHVNRPSAIGSSPAVADVSGLVVIPIFLIIYQRRNADGTGRAVARPRPAGQPDGSDRQVGGGSTVDSSTQPISMYLSAIFHTPSTLRTVS